MKHSDFLYHFVNDGWTRAEPPDSEWRALRAVAIAQVHASFQGYEGQVSS